MKRALAWWWGCGLLLACDPARLVNIAGKPACTQVLRAGPDVASVQNALAAAPAGACVLMEEGRYETALVVPDGVILAAEVGRAVEVTGDPAVDVGISLGRGASLHGITLKPRSKFGVSLAPGAQVISVAVLRAVQVGAISWCEEDCSQGDFTVLNDVDLVENSVGLLVRGGRVRMLRGRILSSQGSSLASGYGAVASNGAVLELDGTVVENNEQVGVLLDGSQGASAMLQRTAVQNNRGRGVWAQSLAGTASAPKLQVLESTLERNRLVGLGARNSRGVLVQGGRVLSTVVGRVAGPSPGVLIEVGDGVGLFDGSSDVQIDSVALERNSRCQVLVDQGLTGLRVFGGSLVSEAGQLGIVVQRTTEMVDAPAVTVLQPGSELPVSAPVLNVPTR
jgi:hypothetical protein